MSEGWEGLGSFDQRAGLVSLDLVVLVPDNWYSYANRIRDPKHINILAKVSIGSFHITFHNPGAGPEDWKLYPTDWP